MSADKYPSIFLRQMETIAYISTENMHETNINLSSDCKRADTRKFKYLVKKHDDNKVDESGCTRGCDADSSHVIVMLRS